MQTKKLSLFKIVFIVFLFISLIGLAFVFSSKSHRAKRIRELIAYDALGKIPEINKTEIASLNEDYTLYTYVNGVESEKVRFGFRKDIKQVIALKNKTKLIDYPNGYVLDLPPNMDFNFKKGKSVIEGKGFDFSYTISLENNPYNELTKEMTDGLKALDPDYTYNDAHDQYIGFYQSRFILNDTWQKNNNIYVSKPKLVKGDNFNYITYDAKINDLPKNKLDGYSFYYVKLSSKAYMRILVKYRSDTFEFKENIKDLIGSIKTFETVGKCKNYTDFKPIPPENWSDETKATYASISNSKELLWGIYTEDMYNNGIKNRIPALEERLDFTFPVVLSYFQFGTPFPSEFMEENYKNGRLVELTFQLTKNNNTDFFAESVLLNMYRGKKAEEEEIRKLARSAKEFGKPFLFRLCNEMNSDWTSYSGVINMNDPEIYVDVYKEIYKIFEEEGVNNCIWIFNPNDRNSPPDNWNDYLNYYPGDKYTQLLGVTGYNNGTYYEEKLECWREFDTIYDQIEDEYKESFSNFPWIITEFSSSSIGGDKAKWIDGMFKNIKKYPNIKIAVWFSSADWDEYGNVSRPYWLDETEETTTAFKNGLEGYKD